MKNPKLRNPAKQPEPSGIDKMLNGISGFFVNNKKVVIIILCVALLALAVLAILLVVNDRKQDELQFRIDGLQTKCEELFQKAEYTPEEYSELLAELQEVEQAGKNSYAGVKAAYVMGLCYLNAQDYANACDSFMKASEKNNKNSGSSYLAPLAVFNAAVCKENLGDTQAAMALYERVPADFGYDTGIAPKALFNSARLHLANGDVDLARSAFQQIVDQYSSASSGSEYAALSKNALMTL
ncbi:MAG: tetratricopeptide repeat protein [Sphaerochaetaceae bacterium]